VPFRLYSNPRVTRELETGHMQQLRGSGCGWNGTSEVVRIAGETDHHPIAYYQGGLLCQSAPINRADDAAPRRTVSTHA